jgi:hypothetical protein
MQGMSVLPPDWRFPSGIGVPLCILRRPAADLAARLAAPLQQWEEDGLGPSAGFPFALADGRGAWATEQQYAREHYGLKGPMIEIDAGDGGRCGLDQMLAEVSSALGLAPEDVGWRPNDPAAWAADAAELAAQAASRHPSRYAHSLLPSRSRK